jgi:ketosteroid isomerase-like protein
MTVHPNLVRARAGYEAFATGDLAVVSDLFSDDVACRRSGHRVSPALDAPGGVLRLAAVPTAPSLCVLAR